MRDQFATDAAGHVDEYILRGRGRAPQFRFERTVSPTWYGDEINRHAKTSRPALKHAEKTVTVANSATLSRVLVWVTQNRSNGRHLSAPRSVLDVSCQIDVLFPGSELSKSWATTGRICRSRSGAAVRVSWRWAGAAVRLSRMSGLHRALVIATHRSATRSRVRQYVRLGSRAPVRLDSGAKVNALARSRITFVRRFYASPGSAAARICLIRGSRGHHPTHYADLLTRVSRE